MQFTTLSVDTMSQWRVLLSVVLDSVRSSRYHARTLWLFTRSDLKTIVLPSTIFAIVHSIAASRLGLLQADFSLFTTLPLTLVWIWINLLAFCAGNQRQLQAIEEDAANKPWRPLPAQRLTREDAKIVMLGSYAVALIVSFYLGALLQCAALIFFGWMYNDLHGADNSPYSRNIINGFGYVCFTSGALEVMLQGNQEPIRELVWWFLCIFTVISTTVHVLDMYDQEGDAATDRKTVPLVIGDAIARYTIVMAMVFWSWFCCWSWSCSVLCYVPVAALGAIVAYRTLTKRSAKADKKTAMIWNLWLTSVFCIPLMKSF